MTPSAILILTLAQACMGEVPPDNIGNGECAAVAHVHRKAALRIGVSITVATWLYSAALKTNRGKRSRRPWITRLKADGSKPELWPSDRAKWSATRPTWLRALAIAEGVVTNEIFDPCAEADHYGSREDWKKRGWNGFERVCRGRGWGNYFGRRTGR